MPQAHVIEVDAAIALVSLIVAVVGGGMALVWLAGIALRHWLRGQDYPRAAADGRQGLGASREDTPGG
ncbi:MAG TPA: hypothetical protein VHZ26_04085 [Caulobacteraceae bacterium]|nr:hypothetical protein [Caulobacteraceae bacterium]